MTKKDYCFLIDTSFDTINEKFKENVYFLNPEIIKTKDNKNEVFLDGINISREEVINLLNDKKYDLKTSQVPLGQIEDKLTQLVKEYKRVYVILITKEFSGMYKTCCVLAKKLNNEYGKNSIMVVDSKSISMFQNLLLNEIEKMHLNNASDKEIEKFIKEYPKKVYAFTIITNANQLIKGGRLTGLKALLVRAFNIKLIIEYANGKLTFIDKTRELKKGIEIGFMKMIEFLQLDQNEIEEICIYSDLDEQENKICYEFVKKLISEKYKKDLQIKKLPTIIITHLGDKSWSLLCKIK